MSSKLRSRILDVNRQVASQQDPERMVQEVCDTLVGNGGYAAVAIALLDPLGHRVEKWASAGYQLGRNLPVDVNQLPSCMVRSLESDGVLVSREAAGGLGTSLEEASATALSSMCHRLMYQGQLYGAIVVAVPHALATDQEGQGLFRDLALDVGAALHRIRTSQALRHATQELKLAQSVFSVAMDHLNVGVAIADAPGAHLRYMNRAGLFIGAGKIVHPETISELNSEAASWEILDFDGSRLGLHSLPLATCIRNGASVSKEFMIRRPGGELRMIQSDAAPIFDERGRVTSGVVVFQDVTERRQGAERIELLGKMLDEAPASITIHDAEGRFLYANRQTLRLHGFEREEQFLALNLRDVDVPESAKLIQSRMAAIARNGEARFTVEHRRSDGTHFPMDVLATAIRWHGKPAILSIATDISAAKQAEAEVRRKEKLLEKVFNILPVGLWFTDRDGTLLRGNPAGVKIWGAEPLVPPSEYGVFKACRLPSREPIGPDQWALAKTITHKIAIQDELLEIEAFDGKRKTILNYSAPVLDDNGDIEAAIVVNLDISDRMALESQLAQAQKLESVGRLAGGVAHDFNNLLLGIMNYVELCRDHVGPDHPTRKWLDEIMSDAQRSASLTRQLLAFARKQAIAPKVFDVNQAVGETLSMLRRLIGEAIDLRWNPAPIPLNIRMDRTQLDQILANLCVNARDAIGGVGEISISTATEQVGEVHRKENLEASPGLYARLTVRDNGCGMEPDVLKNVFEPFFTTKGVGEGTGLGLSTVYGIMRQNGGFVTVQSKPGKGTSFELYFPLSSEPFSESTIRRIPKPRPQSGTETILLVEDEPGLRVTTKLFLERMGYTVLDADSPTAALALVKGTQHTIDLLITDVIMPGMNGVELRRKLLESHPDIKCLMVSGYSADLIVQEGMDPSQTHFLSKPFGRNELCNKVRAILDDEEG